MNRDRNPGDAEGEFNIIPHLIQIRDREGKVLAQSLPLSSLGQTFSTTFDQVGDFDYQCMLHPAKMRGEIKVLPWGMELVQRR